ncbi:hypothetical protein H920_11877 [Fukomys damarensis]|uniref:Uncharacterized protein n=1 Tax=Fukomys damarensis TaxID=885580 RepID=A0A091D3V9_FUKDA|nr:hypothetical protein H920_11877 [Fukomys damarensis]
MGKGQHSTFYLTLWSSPDHPLSCPQHSLVPSSVTSRSLLSTLPTVGLQLQKEELNRPNSRHTGVRCLNHLAKSTPSSSSAHEDLDAVTSRRGIYEKFKLLLPGVLPGPSSPASSGDTDILVNGTAQVSGCTDAQALREKEGSGQES